MAIEQKVEVAILEISKEETAEMVRGFGYELLASERIYGGYASSNVRVQVHRPDDDAESETTLLLKVSHYSATMEDVEHQVFVLQHLKPHNFPTAFVHEKPEGGATLEHNGKCVLLMDFVAGCIPGQDLLVQHQDDAEFVANMMRELGGTLAELHNIPWPKEAEIRDVRTHGYAVCNTGDLLKGSMLDDMDANPRVAGHEFLGLLRQSLPWLRDLYDLELPSTLIHGDAFLDNTLYSPGGNLVALVDWEDSCKGPCVLDLAVCLSACCFAQDNSISAPRFEAVLAGYRAKRDLGQDEVDTLADFMAAGALACAFYRFLEFKVRQADRATAALDNYRIMGERYELLRDEKSEARRTIDRILSPSTASKRRPAASAAPRKRPAAAPLKKPAARPVKRPAAGGR